jgi:hypothetical protein
LKANGWSIVRIPRDGHCLFESFARALRMLLQDSKITMKKLRLECAKTWNDLRGQVPNVPSLFEENASGSLTTKLQKTRGDAETLVTLTEYCQLLKTNLYGGQEEICLLAHMYNLQVNVYYATQFKNGSQSEDWKPHRFLRNCDLEANHPENAGNWMWNLLIARHFVCIVLTMKSIRRTHQLAT